MSQKTTILVIRICESNMCGTQHSSIITHLHVPCHQLLSFPLSLQAPMEAYSLRFCFPRLYLLPLHRFWHPQVPFLSPFLFKKAESVSEIRQEIEKELADAKIDVTAKDIIEENKNATSTLPLEPAEKEETKEADGKEHVNEL